jgi:hypothetical protein
VDFVAFTAALTLLLAYIDRHLGSLPPGRGKRTNLLAHQQLSDQLLLESVLEKLDAISHCNNDTMSIESAKVLRSLVQMKTTAAEENNTLHIVVAKREDGAAMTSRAHYAGEDTVLEIPAPYFGTIRVSRGGTITKTFSQDQGPMVFPQDISLGAEGLSSGSTAHGPAVDMPIANRSGDFCEEFWAASVPPTAGIDQWAFQGVDTAFFDNLMLSTMAASSQGNDGLPES